MIRLFGLSLQKKIPLASNSRNKFTGACKIPAHDHLGSLSALNFCSAKFIPAPGLTLETTLKFLQAECKGELSPLKSPQNRSLLTSDLDDTFK